MQSSVSRWRMWSRRLLATVRISTTFPGPVAHTSCSPTRSTAPGTVSFRQTAAFKYGVAVPFDMGPYYLHALINMFGPARSVVGTTRTVFDEAVGFAGVKLKVE